MKHLLPITKTNKMRSRSLYSALLILIFSCLAIVSCKKDLKNEDIINPNPTNGLPYPAAAPVTGSISGLVLDENNIPVDGAEVSLGSIVTATNARGIFSFENVTMDKYVTTVIVNRPGYFKGYRSFSASASRNYLSIKLTKKTLSGTVNSSSAGNVGLSNGTNLTFQANSMVVKSSGAAYTGTVNVYATYIDPTASDISSTVPGSFMGRDDNNLYALQSTGMIAVELESTTGEALQLASGLPATVRMPIPASIGSKAPSVINTWSLNNQGIWQKEGSASKSGDFYDMQVTHFSFWNCDVPANSTYLTIHVQDQNGNALQNVLVSLSIPNNTSWWGTTYGTTDGNGNVSGVIPADVVMVMQVYPDIYNCGAVYTQNVGPFASTSSITVTATFPNTQEVVVSGTATDCNNQPLQNGTAIIYLNQYNYYYVPVINGSYSDTLPQCVTVSSLNVSVFDAANNSGNSGTVTAGGNNVTVPNITVCGTQSAVFTFGDLQGWCPINYTGSYIAGTPLNTSNAVVITVNVSTPGSYAITTAPDNGISFSASGVFTTVGVQQVVLLGTGTPVNVGYSTFFPQASSGITGCTFGIGVQAPPAGIDLGSGSCTGATVTGDYPVGFQLDPSNHTVILTLNVTSPGSYNITTNTVNGLYFSDSGTVTTTGMQTFVLYCYGAALAPGNTNYTIQYNGVSGCSFTVTTYVMPNANYVFVGAPGACQQASVIGNYDNDSTLTSQHYVYLMVDVAVPGPYNIVTNTNNGISFSGSGTFTSGGTNWVILYGTGQPVNTGVYSYTPTDGSIVGCTFDVNVVD